MNNQPVVGKYTYIYIHTIPGSYRWLKKTKNKSQKKKHNVTRWYRFTKTAIVAVASRVFWWHPLKIPESPKAPFAWECAKVLLSPFNCHAETWCDQRRCFPSSNEGRFQCRDLILHISLYALIIVIYNLQLLYIHIALSINMCIFIIDMFVYIFCY